MKMMRWLLVGLLGGIATLSLVAGTQEKKTYTVVGYFSGSQKPSAELLAKAAQAVGERMAGFTQVQDSNEAAHDVQVLFRRNSFEILVDALPLQREPNSAVEQHSILMARQEGDLAFDRATSRKD